MQRYSAGLQVPKLMTETFTGKTTGGDGDITFVLKYTPKTINQVIVPPFKNACGFFRFSDIQTLTCRSLMVVFKKFMYNKPPASTGTASSGGGGSDPHEHSITPISDDIEEDIAPDEVQGVIVIHYVVEGV